MNDEHKEAEFQSGLRDVERRLTAERESSSSPAGYDANKLADWLDEEADREDEDAEDWTDHGCEEAINNRKRAVCFRRCAELIRAAS